MELPITKKQVSLIEKEIEVLKVELQKCREDKDGWGIVHFDSQIEKLKVIVKTKTISL